jgi:hypothetical protein
MSPETGNNKSYIHGNFRDFNMNQLSSHTSTLHINRSEVNFIHLDVVDRNPVAQSCTNE